VPRWNLDRKLVAGVLVLFLVPTLLAAAVLAYLYRQGTLADPAALAVTVIIGFVTMMAYLGFTAHTIGRTLVRTLQQIQRGTELMASVNPEYRHRIRTGDEMESVAEEINRMADRVRDARLGLETEVARATGDLKVERSKLSAILENVDEGVLVTTLEGTITLANRAAHELLGDALLGRTLFDFVDREKVTYFRERLQAGGAAAERLTLSLASGAVLQAGMRAFLDADGKMTGVVLALRDVSKPAREQEAQHGALTAALQEIRGCLASIRSLSESLLGESAGGQDSRRPLLAAIHAEALRLSALVTGMAGADPLGLARAPSHFEEIRAPDLVTISLRRLGAEGKDPGIIETGALPADLPAFRGEVSVLSVALVSMVKSALAGRLAGGKAWLRPARRGGMLQIEAGAEGPATAADLEVSLDTRLPGLANQPTAREIVRRHAGEVWAFGDGTRFGFRVTFPAVPDRSAIASAEPPMPSAPRFVGAGMASGSGRGDRSPERPLYDFSLFDQMERHLLPADRGRPLDALTFVVFDTETTGLRPEDGHRVISLAGVKIRGGLVKPSEYFDALVKPGRPVPRESVKLHGITEAMLAEAPPVEVVLPAFRRFVEGTVLVGHEVWFDLAFLGRDADRMGVPPLTVDHPVLDTRLLSRVVHGPATEHTLETMAERLGVSIQGRHSALGDALATAEIFVRLLELLNKRGILTLGDALDAARAARGH
jgi:DNA polymerase-3 subunit epsilon